MRSKIIEGKAFSCFLHQPDITSNPQWSLRLVPSEIEQQRFKKLGYKMNMEYLNGSEFGMSVLFKRKVGHMDDVLEKPSLFNMNKVPMEIFEELPNGSNVIVKYSEWERISITDNMLHKGFDLISVVLLDEAPSLF
jgi:hypothetical protein|tara:strand:- start:187 stop:594 length:408 start_codon:yes stop_codon:yes gene_type:complete